jgi:hypothetical protein
MDPSEATAESVERAAICEFDGGFSHLEASLIACWCLNRRTGKPADVAVSFRHQLENADELQAMLEDSVKPRDS